MADPPDSGITPEPADSMKAAGPAETGTSSTPESPRPMLDVHPPQDSIHTWRSFFIHIATIVIGLFIAVGLEQTVEYFHHRHQTREIEQQIHNVFESNLRIDAEDLKSLIGLRTYLSSLRVAIANRLTGGNPAGLPPLKDSRLGLAFTFPSLAPYEAAKENGTVALLSSERIRIYNRVAWGREMLVGVRWKFYDNLATLAAFHKRFVDSTGSPQMGDLVAGPDLGALSRAELAEYLADVSAVANGADDLYARIRVFDIETRAILDGVLSEDELMARVYQQSGGSWGPPVDRAIGK
jgi:hypothetical protein